MTLPSGIVMARRSPELEPSRARLTSIVRVLPMAFSNQDHGVHDYETGYPSQHKKLFVFC
jgi:hypothetical protein